MGNLVGTARRIDLIWIDRVVAVALVAAGIADAASEPHLQLGPVAVVALVAMLGSIAWRRVNPLWTTAASATGLIVFEVASKYHGDGTAEVAALALNFYAYGRRFRTHEDLRAALCLFAFFLGAAAVTTDVPPGGTLGSMIGAFFLASVLPFAIGLTLERRRALALRLAANNEELRGAQELRAQAAATEERIRMARELHDVVAHCVSVMVVQAQAARRVAAAEPGLARKALGVVERSGREALVELRRTVGVLRRSSEHGADPAHPGVGQLDELVARAETAGLAVELDVEGPAEDLSPGLDLVVYRIVQEALTNAIKHAGQVAAAVNVTIGPTAVDLSVTNAERVSARVVQESTGGGHGLIGMAERVRVYGGELRAVPAPDGGFELSAHIPLTARPVDTPDEIPVSIPPEPRVENELRWPWLDPVLACVVLVALETAVLVGPHRRGPLVLNVALVAMLALAAIWRRRQPLAFLLVVGGLGLVMNAFLTPLTKSSLVGAYFVLFPTYAVAAWGSRRTAATGLAIFIAGAAVSNGRHGAGDVAGAAFALCASWAAGRAIRSYREATSELRRTSARLEAEREYRAALAVAGERSRIARELHAVVARSVEAMVVEARAAPTAIDTNRRVADDAMEAIEQTGRTVMADMRRVLGVLRHGGDQPRRTPQPGVDQVYRLIERAREQGKSVELTVDGEAGTLAAGVELGLYRILENALGSADGAVRVSLSFGERELELRITGNCSGPNRWPTAAMRERLALCGGSVEADGIQSNGWCFNARMPRGLQEAVV